MPVPTREVKNPPHGATPQGARVLLIHENFRELAYHHAVLRNLGCRVTACTSYEEGRRLLAQGQWDLVMVSQGSAAFEGRSVLERAIEINRYTPVLILTRWHDIRTYLTAMHLGAVDYLEEPVPPTELARVVSSHARPLQRSA
jgi:DNA-binding response OmpR family regulator